MILFLVENVELIILALSLYHVKFARRVAVHTKPDIRASNLKRDIVARSEEKKQDIIINSLNEKVGFKKSSTYTRNLC